MHLNATLERRIAERTTELSMANNELMREVAERERAQAANERRPHWYNRRRWRPPDN